MRAQMSKALLAVLSSVTCFAQLAGVVDIHTHGDPDSRPRRLDVVEWARSGKAAGMRAIVLKNHYAPTAQAAYLVRQIVPGIEVYAGFSLDLPVGGVNVAAVDQAHRFKGDTLRIVWMPTFDSENNVKFAKSGQPFVPVSKNGRLLPEVITVLQYLAKNNLVLATGHSTAEEDLMLVKEARALGVKQIVVTHPLSPAIHMTIPQMQEAAKMGAFIEFCAGQVMPGAAPAWRNNVKPYVDAIRAIGPEHAILSSDLGQPENPPPMEGWKLYLDMLRKGGITNAELDRMSKTNPATLLGLK